MPDSHNPASLPKPTEAVAIRMASALIHADEFMSPHGHEFDLEAFRRVFDDPDVSAYLQELDALALLPLRRDG